MKTVLHIGAGGDRLGWADWREITCDLDPATGCDVIGPAHELPWAETGCATALFASHVLEHIEPALHAATLAEWRRTLNDEGFAIVCVPDMQALARFVLEDRADEIIMHTPGGPVTAFDAIYGLRAWSAYQAHCWGFTARTLAKALQAAGFGSVACKTGGNYEIVAAASAAVADETFLTRILALRDLHWAKEAA